MRYFLFVFLLTGPFAAAAQSSYAILPLEQQALLKDELLAYRLNSLLPELMRRNGIDCWIISGREYNEDPVLRTMLPATWLNARRRTVLMVFAAPGKTPEFFAVARYDVGTVFKRAWDPEKQPDQLKRVAEIIKEKNPAKIGINVSADENIADGLSHSEHEALMAALPKNLQTRVVSAEMLAVNWLETRTDRELALYESICRISHRIIKEAFSEAVITPGITSTAEVVWWMREKVRALGLQTWFHPTVDVQRAESDKALYSFASKPDAESIRHGDIVHCDFGIEYLGLHTDMQENVYILKPGETSVPQELVDALKKGNEAQDILTGSFKTGKTGNAILADAIAEAARKENKATFYTHPIGYHGHAAGPTIGLWDNQKFVSGTGEYPMQPNTAYAIELNTKVFIPSWNKEVRIMLEENAVFDGTVVRYIDGRQTEWMTLPEKR